MNHNIEKGIYWISTFVMCGIFTFSAQMYFRNPDMVKGFFKMLSYPEYLVIPLAILKVLGIIAVLTRLSKMLTEWAYAGFFLDAVLAFTAHYALGQSLTLSGIAIASIIVSRYMYGRLYL